MTVLNFLSMAAPVAIIDALNELLEAEMISIIRFMGEGSPYVGRASADIRQPLQEMVHTSFNRCRDLHGLIEQLGGVPRRPGLNPQEQYLAFLSISFLLPKLIDAKQLAIRRCETTLAAIRSGAPTILHLLERHLAEHHRELATLEKASIVRE